MLHENSPEIVWCRAQTDETGRLKQGGLLLYEGQVHQGTPTGLPYRTTHEGRLDSSLAARHETKESSDATLQLMLDRMNTTPYFSGSTRRGKRGKLKERVRGCHLPSL